MSGTWPWGAVGQKEHWLSVESLIKEVAGGVGSGLVDLYVKGVQAGEASAIFRN